MTGRAAQPEHVAQQAEDVDNWRRFRSAALESQYRHQQAPYDALQSTIFLTVILITTIALTLSDYRLFGFSSLFWRLAVLRAGFAGVSLLIIARLQRGLTPPSLHRTVLFWSLLLVVYNIFIASTRPPGYLIQAILNVFLVLMCYLVLPLPLTLQTIPAILMSIGNIALVIWLNSPADQLTSAAIIGAFVVVNVLGALTSRQVHYWKRQQFVAMLRQIELRAELEQALAEIKTLRGILPICSHCKRVRDDTGYWQQVEVYVRDRSYAEFSHSICPSCIQAHYGELSDS
jgi:hypothetical protein